MSNFFKILLSSSVLLFLLIQIQGFLDLGVITFILYIIEFVLYVVILMMVLIGLYRVMNKPLKSHKIVLWNCIILLGLIIYKPFGLINDKMIYGDDLLFAQQEGVASCTSSISLKEKGKYIQSLICFGLTRKVGNFTLKNDTVYFDTIIMDQYKYGVINRKDSILEMFFLHPKTSKDFNQFKLDSVQIQRKIEQSRKTSYKIYSLNGI